MYYNKILRAQAASLLKAIGNLDILGEIIEIIEMTISFIISNSYDLNPTPENKRNDETFCPAVIIVQNKANDIFKEKISQLEKIHKIAQLVDIYNAGNCQEQVFYVLIKALEKKGVTIPLEVAYYDTHFVLIIGDKSSKDTVICDPWAAAVFPYAEKSHMEREFNSIYCGDLKTYLKIDSKGYIEEAAEVSRRARLQPDPLSTSYLKQTFHCFGPQLDKRSNSDYSCAAVAKFDRYAEIARATSRSPEREESDDRLRERYQGKKSEQQLVPRCAATDKPQVVTIKPRKFIWS